MTLTMPPPEGTAVRDPATGDLHTELAALHAEREPLVVDAARAALLSEQATRRLDECRAAWDAAVLTAREQAAAAAKARRALDRHDAAIAEVQAEIAAGPGPA